MNTNLKELCKLLGIKQETLAKEMGVSQGIVSGWSNNRYYPSAENLIQLSKILNVTAGCILGLEPIPEGYPNHIKPVQYKEAIKPEIQPVIQPAAEAPKNFRPKKAPFSQEQMDYLDNWGDRLTEKIVDSLKEDTSLLKETGTMAK